MTGQFAVEAHNESNLRISACEYAAPTTRLEPSRPAGLVTFLLEEPSRGGGLQNGETDLYQGVALAKRAKRWGERMRRWKHTQTDLSRRAIGLQSVTSSIALLSGRIAQRDRRISSNVPTCTISCGWEPAVSITTCRQLRHKAEATSTYCIDRLLAAPRGRPHVHEWSSKAQR